MKSINSSRKSISAFLLFIFLVLIGLTVFWKFKKKRPVFFFCFLFFVFVAYTEVLSDFFLV